MLKLLDTFSGIGGFSLGLERTGGFKTIGFCEVDSFCQKVLKKHWSDVPIFDDIKLLTAESIRERCEGLQSLKEELEYDRRWKARK